MLFHEKIIITNKNFLQLFLYNNVLIENFYVKIILDITYKVLNLFKNICNLKYLWRQILIIRRLKMASFLHGKCDRGKLIILLFFSTKYLNLLDSELVVLYGDKILDVLIMR